MAQMRAILIAEHGGLEVINIRNCSLPEPREDEVRIKVEACALNRADLSIIEGLSGPGIREKRLPIIPGVDIAGVVVAS